MSAKPARIPLSLSWVPAQAALILFAVGWIYGPAVHGPFVWDDYVEIAHNPVLRDPGGLARIWAGSAGPDYFPLKTSLQWLLWRMGGNDPAPYHLLNIGLHFLSALLFWRLLRDLGLRLAWIGGLLFAVHPLAVESVAWIAELKNALSLPWLIGAMIAYVGFDRVAPPPSVATAATSAPGAEARRLYLLSLGCFLLALLSKSSVVMFPLVIPLHAWWKRGRISARDFIRAAPFAALSLALGLVTIFLQYARALGREWGGWAVPLHGLGPHLAVAGTSLAFYLWKSLVPAALHLMYRPWRATPPSAAEFLPWLGLALLGAWAWYRRNGWGRHVILGLGFFVLNLVPVLGFLPMSYMHISWVADHFAYLPLLGIAGLGAGAAGAVWARAASAGGPGRMAVAAVIAAVAATLALWSRGDAEHFGRPGELWRSVLRLNPDAWMAHIDLGQDLAQNGHYLEAVDQDTQALRIRSDLPEAYYNRGSNFLHLGRLPEAIGDFERSLQIQPGDPDVLLNLGVALSRSGRWTEALARYRQAWNIQPGAADIRTDLEQALLRSIPASVEARRLPEAEENCEELLRLDPGNAEAHGLLGNILFLQGRLPEAVAQYQAALQIDPGNAGTRTNLDLAERAWRRRTTSPPQP